MAGATEMAMLTLPITAPRRPADQGEDGGHQQRQHDGGAAGLDDAGQQQDFEARRKGGQQRAGGKQSHGQHEHGPGGQPLQDEPGGGDDDGHGEHEARGQPLHGGGIEFRSTISRCRATFMMVSLRITTKVATSSVAMMATDSRGIFAGAVGAVDAAGAAGVPIRGWRGQRPVRDRQRRWKRRLLTWEFPQGVWCGSGERRRCCRFQQSSARGHSRHRENNAGSDKPMTGGGMGRI